MYADKSTHTNITFTTIMASNFVSKLGIIQRMYLMTERSSLKGVLVEQIHAPLDGPTIYNKHLIHKFTYKGIPYLLIAKDKFIPRDITSSRILTLHTPRKMNGGQSTADIGFHGYGSKLIYFQTEAEAIFVTHTGTAADYLYDVGDFAYINSEIKRLTIDAPPEDSEISMDGIEGATKNSIDDDLYHPTARRPRSILNEEDFMNSLLGQFIKDQEFKTFIILKNVNKMKNPELSDEKVGPEDKEWRKLQDDFAQLFSTNIEAGELDIYFGSGLNNAPTKLTVSHDLCLTPSFWLHSMRIEYMLTHKKHAEYDFWENTGRWIHPSNYGKDDASADSSKDIYFRFFINIAGNGSPSTRCKRLKGGQPAEWKAHMRITMARVKDEFIERSTYSKEELGGGAFIFIGDYLINNIPQKINSAIMRNLPGGYNYRTRVDIIDESLYTILKGSGVELAPIKINSYINNGSNTMKTINDTLKIANNWFKYLDTNEKLNKTHTELTATDITELNKIFNYETYKAENNKKTQEGSDKGYKIEQVIGDACTEHITTHNGTTVLWEQGDSLISSRYGLKNKGVDLMATVGNTALLIQIKSSNTFISVAELDKFYNTCVEYAAKQPSKNVRRLLIIKGPATMRTNNFNKLALKSIYCLAYNNMENSTEFLEEIVADIQAILIQ